MVRIVRTAFDAVFLFVLVVFITALLARVVPPSLVWWLQSLAILIPLLALVVLLLSIIAMVAGRRVLAVVGLLVLAIMIIRNDFGMASTGNEVDELVIATLNTGGRIREVSAYDRGIPELLEKYRPDILCVQELWTGRRNGETHTHTVIHQALDTLGYRFVARSPERESAVPSLITRLDVGTASVMVLPNDSADSTASSMLRAEMTFGEVSLTVYNVDLRGYSAQLPTSTGKGKRPDAWFRFFRASRESYVRRAEDAEAMRTQIGRESGRTLVCGDFNSTPHEWSYGILSDELTDTYEACGGVWGPTFPADRPLVRIDYILAGREWEVTGCDVGPRLKPDHLPVISRLKLEP